MHRIVGKSPRLVRLFLAVILCLSVLAIPTPRAFAATTTISGSVKDSSSVAVGGASLTFTDLTHPGTVTATADASGNYSALVTSLDTYNLQASPPGGSSLVSSTYYGKIVAGTTYTFNFTLRDSTHTISGVVQDKNSVALPGETVSLYDTNGTIATTTSDASGNYSLTAPSYAYYTLQTQGTKTVSSAVVPDHFIWSSLRDMTSDNTVNVTIQATTINLSIREPSGAVPVGLASTSINLSNVHTTGGFTTPPVSGSWTYTGTASGSGMHPDSNGNYTLILPSNSLYSMSVNGSSYDGYGSATISNNSLGTSDINLTVTLPTTRHTVSGTVSHVASENGASYPIAGLTVTLGNVTTGRYQTATTDASGHYSFTAGASTFTGTAYSLSLSQSSQPSDPLAMMPGTLNASMSLDLSADRTGNINFTFDPIDFTVYDSLAHTIPTNVKITSVATNNTMAAPFTGAGSMTVSFTSNYTTAAYGAPPLYLRLLIDGLTYNNTFSGPTSPATVYGSVTSNGFVTSTPYQSLQVYVPNNMTAPSSFTNTTATPGYPSFSWSYTASGTYAANHYNIYQGSSLIGTTTSTSYTDTSVSGTGNGQYQVSAVNAQGTEGPRTSVLSINYTTP